MPRRERIEALRLEFLIFLEDKKIPEEKKKRLAIEFAGKTERAMHPVGSMVPRVSIEDTYNQNKMILITLRNPLSTDVAEVLESYLERMGSSRPNIKHWRITQAVGSPMTLGATYRCEVVTTPIQTSRETPSSKKKKEAQIASKFFTAFENLSPEKQREFIEKLGNQKKG